MKSSSEHIGRLWQLYIANKASAAEVEELFQYLHNSAQDEENAVLIREALLQFPSEMVMDAEKQEHMLKMILTEKGKENLPVIQLPSLQDSLGSPVRTMKTTWLKYAVAVLLVFGAGTYLFITNKAPNEKIISPGLTQEIEPGSDKAILTLSDGRSIVLGDSSIQPITDGKTQINQKKGVLTYFPALTSEIVPVTYNTMATPRGGQYQLVLPDGTKVWLNAMSSIRFPTTFSGKERKVEIQGEVYFEVKGDPGMPFKVSVNEVEVVVLGTVFNVNAYADEKEVTTTLIEGRVRVNARQGSQILLPEEQVRIFSSDPVKTIKGVNTDQVIAWKNGSFNFNHLPFDQVMRQLSRWYDIEVKYENTIPSLQLWGTMGRDLTLSQVLEGLKQTGVRFRLEGRRLVILP